MWLIYFFILFILIRVVILISKLRLNWSRKYFLIDFEWKSRIWSLIAVIGYAICLIPDMYYNIIVYLYEGEYLIRILVLPPPIILGLIDLYLFKPRKKMLSWKLLLGVLCSGLQIPDKANPQLRGIKKVPSNPLTADQTGLSLIG